jgi:hypothetical protein
MLELLKFYTSGFWIFIGSVIIMSLIINGILKIFTRIYRMIMVSRKGWPPSHLDADGDWKPKSKEEK